MNFLTQSFNTILYQPFLNALVLLYVYIPGHDFGLAVIALTLIIKLLLHPLSLKSIRSQKAMSVLQPKIKEIQRKYKDDRQEQSRAMMDLYKKEKISPTSGCLPLLIQLPIIIALYRVFLSGLTQDNVAGFLYSFVPNPGVISTNFLGVVSLENKIFIIMLAIITAVFQFYQVKKSSSANKTDKKDFASAMQKQMLFIIPLMSFFIIWKIGAIIGLYWLTSVVFTIAEQSIVNKRSYGQETQEKSRENN